MERPLRSPINSDRKQCGRMLAHDTALSLRRITYTIIKERNVYAG
jgi:hypothetical protein